MARELNGKTAVVTGGATGIGLEIADNFIKNGATVVIVLDINEKQGEKAVGALKTKYGSNRAVFIKCDVKKDLEEASKKIFCEYKVDLLVNNAGVLDEMDVKKTIGINVTALIEWSLAFRENMRIDKGGNGGTIINLASIYGLRIDQFLPVYQASKYAVFGFTKSLGHKYNFDRTGVRVVALCPGFTETKMTSHPRTWPDEQLQLDFYLFLKIQPWQQVETVGRAAVDVFKRADSGSAWLVEGSKPVREVS